MGRAKVIGLASVQSRAAVNAWTSRSGVSLRAAGVIVTDGSTNGRSFRRPFQPRSPTAAAMTTAGAGRHTYRPATSAAVPAPAPIAVAQRRALSRAADWRDRTMYPVTSPRSIVDRARGL